MNAVGWQDEGGRFRLVHSQVGGIWDPTRPGAGVFDVSIAGQVVEGSRLFALRWLSTREGRQEISCPQVWEDIGDQGGCVLRDCWTCGRDLLAEYVPQFGEDASLVVRLRLKTVPGAAARRDLVVEVLLSFQSLEFLTYPRVCLGSHLPAGVTWQFADRRGEELRPVESGDVGASVLEVPSFLLDMPALGWSYYELVHPSDVHTAGVMVLGDNGAANSQLPGSGVAPSVATGAVRFRTWYCLFSGPVERGVILRARLQGRLSPGPLSREVACQAWRELVEAPLPLSD